MSLLIITIFYGLLITLGLLSLANIALMILVFIGSRYFKPKKYKNFSPPISVILPAYNEEENIAACLDSIIASDYQSTKLEIICINDKSNDNTLSIMKDYAKRYKNIKIIQGKHQGKSVALNLGIEEAKNDIVLTIDADMILNKQFIKLTARPFSDSRVACTFGLILVSKPRKLIEHYQAIEYYFLNLVRTSVQEVLGYPLWFSGQAALFRKKLIKKVGGFNNSTLSEDLDISLRLFTKYSFVYVREAVSYTKPLTDIGKLFRQRERWNFGGIQCLIRHKGQIKFNNIAIVHIYFIFFLWMVNSIIFFPYLIFWYIKLLLTNPASFVFLWIKAGTVVGPVAGFFKQSLGGYTPSLSEVIYLTLGCLFLALFSIALVTYSENRSIRLLFAYLTYFTYIAFLQLSYITSFYRYRGQKNAKFIKSF